MKAHGFVVAFLGLFLFLSGCTHRFSLSLEKGEPVKVTTLGADISHTFQPGTDGYQKLAGWLAKNQSGWNRYFATPPAQGRTVGLAAHYQLQFLDSTVILHTPDGLWIKSAAPSDSPFLAQ